MWEFKLFFLWWWRGNGRYNSVVATGICILLFLHLSRSEDDVRSVNGGDGRRSGRLVISSRQFRPGQEGVGEVFSVDADEFEKLVKEQNISVVKGEVVNRGGGSVVVTSGAIVGNGSSSERGGEVQVEPVSVSHAGVRRVAVGGGGVPVGESSGEGGSDFGGRSNVTSTTTTGVSVLSSEDVSSATSGPPVSTSTVPVPAAVAVANPEDSSRGTQQDTRFVPAIDRRKVGGKPEGGNGNPDISFTGILNGLLDSFINDGPPPPPPSQRQPPRNPPTTSTTTQHPSSEDVSVQDDEEEELEESSPEEDTRQKNSGKSSLSKPSLSPSPSTTEELSNEENVSEEPLEEDEDLNLDDYKLDQSNSSKSPPQQSTKACEGECRNIIFGLFLCDEIDNDAFCPESGLACCVNNPEPEYNRYKPYGNGSSEEDHHPYLDNEHDMDKVPVATQQQQESSEDVIEEEELEDDEHQVQEDVQKEKPPPQQQQQPQSFPPPNRYPPNYGNRPPPPPHYNPQKPPPPYYYPHPPQQNAPPPMMIHPSRMPLPCHRYCVKNYHETYCSDRLPNQFSCGMDAFCCSHPVNVKEEKQPNDPNEEEEERDEGLGQGEDDAQSDGGSSVKKIIGPCTEEVGSCVSKNIINIICFAHATPTDMYTCPRSSMKCCARKTALPKDALPSTTTRPPTLDNTITRNASSQIYSKPQQLPPPPPPPPQGPPQINPQFVPGPPPHHPFPTQQFHQQPQQMPQPTHAPNPPPLAETPPPPIGSQFQNPFSSNALGAARQPVGQYVCGVKGVPTVSKKRRRKRVVGGSDSLPGEWCWQVALINSLNQYLCGGALIGTQWVLTAAHCVTNIVRSGDAIYVRVGDHDLTSRYGSPGAQTLRVATTYIHHNHNSQTLDNDIALLKLQGNAALKEGVCLVCLPSRNHMSEQPGKRCTVTGYGYMGESGPIPLRIREANLPIVSDDECVRKVNAVTEKVFSLPMSSFCAGGDNSGNDACQGDGGGPLVCRADDPNTGDTGIGYYELTGLVSWGFGCARENVPGVYVRVSSFIGWIHQIIRSN